MTYANIEGAKKIQAIIPKIQNKFNAFINKHHLERCKNTITLGILIGGTGSGKSTFLNLLAGQSLIIKDNYGNLVLEAPNQNISKISHGNISETEIPNLWYDSKQNVIFCDCPGFFDTKGSIQETINIFSIVTLLNFTKRVKIILMISEDDSVSLKGQFARRQFEIIENLSKVKSSDQGICMVLTKAQSKLKNEAYLKKHLSRMGAYEAENKLLNLVSNDPHKRIFIFSEPPDDAIDNSQYHEFSDDDMNRFIKFVKDENDMFQSSDKVPLNETSLHFILSLINNLNQTGTLIQQIISYMRNDCESKIKNSTYSIQQWRNNINNIKNSRYFTLNQLVSKFKENFDSNKYSSIYDQIEQIQSLIPILQHIDSSKLENGNAQAYQNFINSTSIYNLQNDINEGLDGIMRIINSEERRIETERRRQEEERRRIEEERRRREALERQRREEERRRQEEERRRREEELRLEEERRRNELEQERLRKLREQQQAQRERELAEEQARKLRAQVQNYQPRVEYHYHYSGGGGGCTIF